MKTVTFVLIFSIGSLLFLRVALAEKEGGNLKSAENSPYECKAAYETLDKEIKAANYCKQDSDCVVLATAEYIEFGCFHYVNKSVIVGDIYSKLGAHDSKCSTLIND